MTPEVKPQTNQLRDYASLFSRNEVYSWIKKDFTSINRKVERYDSNWKQLTNKTYLDYLRYVYSVLEKNYQNEYIFKNEFLNKWLLSALGEKDSKIFSEFRVGKSIADLAMFNGCSKVFEIKTELDTENRLALQIESYKHVFNEIYLLVPESKIELYKKYEKTIGLITFSNKAKDSFSVYRKAIPNFEICPAAIMQILHTNEYKSIVKHFYKTLPKLTSFNQFEICKELVCEIPKTALNQLFINEIKKRGQNKVISPRNFKEFNQLFLALKFNNEEKANMIEILKTPLQN